jgi:paraquat-inducible protein B
MMAGCGCDLRSLSADGNRIELEVENAAGLLTRKTLINGYTIDLQRVTGGTDAWRVTLIAEVSS